MDHDYQVYADDPAWVLVPEEPTEAMKQAGEMALDTRGLVVDYDDGLAVWAAMLAAAPPPPASSDGWRDIGSADRSVDLVVGCWVVDDDPDTKPYWSAWVVPAGEPLGCDGAWGDEPTHCQPAPTPPVAPRG